MTIINDGNDEIVLLGHSTGGLILSLYANDRKNIPEIKALVLNSPFLDMNMSWMMENITVPFVSFVGGIFPNIRFPQSASPGYAHSLLKEYNGEWDYNTEWKLINSPAVTSGWIKEIHNGHKKIHKGLNIDIPVVVMHSDKSFMGDNYTPEFSVSDVVLDVNDIEKYAKGLGSDVKTVTVVNGVHDLILSKKEARDAAYAEIFEVLESQKNNKVN